MPLSILMKKRIAMKTLIINAGIYPLPAVKGGGVETLIQMFIDNTNLADITIVSVEDNMAKRESKKYPGIKFLYVPFDRKKTIVQRGVFHLINKLCNRPVGNYYIHRVAKIVDFNQYDVIISENGVGFGSFIRPKTKAKIVLHLHNDWLNSNTRFGAIYKNSFDEIWTISAFLKNRVDQIPALAKTKILYNGVDLSLFCRDSIGGSESALAEEFGIKENDFIVGSCSRIVEEKGILQLQNAIKRIKRIYNIKNIKLLIIGDLSNPTEYIQRVRQNADESMIMTGYIDHAKLPLYFKLMDVLVAPTVHLKKYSHVDGYRGVQEGFNLTVIEALGMGIPAIITDSGGMPEIIADNNVGCIISALEETIENDLVNSIHKFYAERTDEKVRERCKKAAASFSKEKYCATYERYLRELH